MTHFYLPIQMLLNASLNSTLPLSYCFLLYSLRTLHNVSVRANGSLFTRYTHIECPIVCQVSTSMKILPLPPASTGTPRGSLEERAILNLGASFLVSTPCPLALCWCYFLSWDFSDFVSFIPSLNFELCLSDFPLWTETHLATHNPDSWIPA